MSLEEKSRQRARRANIKFMLLESVKVAGLLSLAVVVPNVIGALDKLGFIRIGRRDESIRVARNRMIQQGLIARKDGFLMLTRKGEKELLRLQLSSGSLARPKKWDGKWRLLIFDVPNSKKGLRDRLRHSLVSHGFHRLQHSVWVYPHNCEDFVALLKAELRVGKDMQYLIVDSIENDKLLLDTFGLA